jgi:hypothetical protein
VALDGVSTTDGSRMSIQLPKDAHKLEDLVERERLGLLILDPVTAYMGSRDSNSQQEVRDAIQPLSGIAERTGCAILLSNHTSKGWKDRDAAFIGQGSIAFTAVARVQLLLARAPHERPERVLWVTKSNVGPDTSVQGRAFNQQIERFHDVPVCSWTGRPWHESLEQFLEGHRKSREVPARGVASEWLEEVLGSQGWTKVSQLVAMARAEGIAERTLFRALKDGDGRFIKRGIRSKGIEYSLADSNTDMEVCNV